MYTRRKEMKAVIKDLRSISEPQLGKLIGAYDLCKRYEDWKEDQSLAFRKLCSTAYPEIFEKCIQSLNTFFKDFEQQVKGEIVHEGDFLEYDDDDCLDVIDDRYDIERVWPVSTLKKTSIVVPEGFTHFMILPVDYNRGGDDIGIAWMTRKGKKNYSQYLTGDY